METAMQLLMRDGAIRFAFHPHLTSEQYAELLEQAERSTTIAEMRRALKAAAKRWGDQVVIEP